MSDILDQKIFEISEKLKNKQKIQKIKVRELLEWANSYRRGRWVVYYIRSVLDKYNIVTVPDFDAVYIGRLISFRLKEDEQNLGGAFGGMSEYIPNDGIEIGTDSADVSLADIDSGDNSVNLDDDDVSDSGEERFSKSQPIDELSARVTRLSSAGNMPIYFSPNDKIRKAITVMLEKNISKAPIMTGPRDVKGLLSYDSILSRLTICNGAGAIDAFLDMEVRKVMDERVPVINSNESIFDLPDKLKDEGFVLVQENGRLVTGSVSWSDLSLGFVNFAQPYLMVGTIENFIADLIGKKFDNKTIFDFIHERDRDLIYNEDIMYVSKMSFGDYYFFLNKEDNWSKTGLGVDRSEFCKLLNEVREIRNSIMHFNTDKISDGDQRVLERFLRFVRRIISAMNAL